MSLGVLKEFPRYTELLPDIEGFKDTSWHNDACPSIGMELAEYDWLMLFIDYPNPEDREVNHFRYALMFNRDGEENQLLCDSDDLEEIKKTINEFLKEIKNEKNHT